MTTATRATEHTSRQLRSRIFSVLPAASFQMDKLLSLVDIVATQAVPSAAVECLVHPRLLLNPDFVAQHCRTDEHLFMLVMHELQHVVLGHTRLFPRPTRAHNLAFDAVINALLCRQFPGRAFTSFFQAINPWDSFPARLLRPPPGWPASPEPLPADATDGERRVHEQLYGKGGNVTYHEVFELLVKVLGRDGAAGDQAHRGDRAHHGDQADPEGHSSSGDASGPDADADPVLLGDHSGAHWEGAWDAAASQDATLRGVLRRVVEGWPPPDRRIAGRDLGRTAGNWFLKPAGNPALTLRAALRRLLARAGVLGGAANTSKRMAPRMIDMEVETVLPQLGDRRAHAWLKLYGKLPVLYRERTQQRRWRLSPRPVAHVYLDVSGSMNAALPALAAVLRPLHRERAIKLFVFSTVIDEVRPGDLTRQGLANTGGTDIRCVLAHLAAMPCARRPRRTLLLTDGYVGPVPPDAFAQLGTTLYVGMYGPLGIQSINDLEHAARHVERLPELPRNPSSISPKPFLQDTPTASPTRSPKAACSTR